ncbi:hypothetical protein [Arundinibacter roseus]|uniref:Lipoprotein n=1 Tax=Arundinibacter roseus TaxID=2070510 RepID=A0A4R4K3C1_9BACT|nr:hypothetical protein [Arundinibacter roseus]TDB61828.1 hypothetical protein EZE20_18970 [Arundinibacter roseus]
MRIFKKVSILASVFLFTQCATTSPSQSPTLGRPTARVDTQPAASSQELTLDKSCPLDKVQWLYASKEVNLAKQQQLAQLIAEAALVDATTLDQMVSNNSNNPLAISSSLKALIDKMAETKTPVSDAFYKEYVNSRMTMCAVIEALRNGSIKKDQSSKVAGTAFKDVVKTFEKFE